MTLSDAQIIERLERVEEQLRLLSAAAGIPFAGGVPDEVMALARADERIKAALKLTEMTGMDFDAAQRVVNRL
jgi:hypothetical protein